MQVLQKKGLADALRERAALGRPTLGICLGMQLLMRCSYEFGRHGGLGLLDGEVVKFEGEREDGRQLKVPHVGWNHVKRAGPGWRSPLLSGLEDGEYMYFVHSYHVVPADPSIVCSTTQYGDTEFCSSLCSGSIFACQFHPERSGPVGLGIYKNVARMLSGGKPHLQEDDCE